MKIIEHFFLASLALSNIACSVSKADKPLDVNFYKIRKATNGDALVSDQAFEDSRFIISAEYKGPAYGGFLTLTVKNKTDSTAKILWDDTVFVDPNGISHRTIRSGTHYLNSTSSMAPTVILSQGTQTERITSAENSGYTPGGRWYTKGLLGHIDTGRYFPAYDKRKDEHKDLSFHEYMALKREADQTMSRNLFGKDMGLLLAIEVNGKKLEYYLSFNINGIRDENENKRP